MRYSGFVLPARRAVFLRQYRFVSGSTGGETKTLSQKELREKAVAEALAKEEEAAAHAKALYELRERTKELIRDLSESPLTLINERLTKLQQDLNAIPSQEKVKQLDEELEDFMFKHMNLPKEILDVLPWSGQSTHDGKNSKDDGIYQKDIKSTTTSSWSSEFPNLKPTPDYKPYSEQELYLRQLAHARQSGSLGSTLTDIYVPRKEVLSPLTINDVSIPNLLAAGCHLGHAKSMWRPSTQPYIYGEYDGIHLIDLNETFSALKRACLVIEGVSAKGGIILYVGTSHHWEQHRALEEAAKRTKGYYVSQRWIPGTITNFTEVTRQITGQQVVELDMKQNPTGRNLLEEASSRLVKPDLVILLNPVENRNCINECIKLRVPTIGLCDTDMEPSLLTYPIPCNDDSMRVSSMITGILSRSAEAGLKRRLEIMESYQGNKTHLRRDARGMNRRR